MVENNTQVNDLKRQLQEVKQKLDQQEKSAGNDADNERWIKLSSWLVSRVRDEKILKKPAISEYGGILPSIYEGSEYFVWPDTGYSVRHNVKRKRDLQALLDSPPHDGTSRADVNPSQSMKKRPKIVASVKKMPSSPHTPPTVSPPPQPPGDPLDVEMSGTSQQEPLNLATNPMQRKVTSEELNQALNLVKSIEKAGGQPIR